MQVTVTIKFDEQVARKAKLIAKRRNKSLSDFITDLVREYPVDDIEIKDSDITPSVRALMGIVTIPDDFDPDKERLEYLKRKILHD